MTKYLDNKELLNVVRRYRKYKRKKDYEIIGSAFKDIVNHLLYRPNFANYTDDIKSDMISDACYYMTKYFNNFDEKKSNNIFGYLTTIAWRAIIANVNKFKKYQKLFVRISSLQFLNESENVNENYIFSFRVNPEFIEKEIKRMADMGIFLNEEFKDENIK